MELINKDIITRNVKAVVNNIKEICDDISTITVVLATKNRTVSEAKYAASFFKNVRLAENKAQSFRDKYTNDLIWDFIGQVQRNKIKYLIGKANTIQSVCDQKTCDEIERLCIVYSQKQEIFLQINAGNEENKAGLEFNAVNSFYSIVQKYPRIIVKGLMVVTPLNTNIRREYFKEAKNLFDSLQKSNPNIQHLSMGMSNDYMDAILEGSNMIRLGRAIFDA
ncbi:MAG TPA: YggS family pyridoxal phosphate-dependent enzyme [Clostridia bacterium]|jgi:hypothetical protein|nr:YggS family pyridoxal phosphate-dependent enzyme [Clostridia bacterium]